MANVLDKIVEKKWQEIEAAKERISLETLREQLATAPPIRDFFAAIESDPEFVEARASLGCVLADTGQAEFAVAAFRGALSLHEGYSETHYNLARLLDDLGREVESRHHWNRFLELAPDSPWANEATERIEAIDTP